MFASLIKQSKVDYERKYSNIKQTGSFESTVVRLVTLIIACMEGTDSVWDWEHSSNG